jgi:hypothetical protein
MWRSAVQVSVVQARAVCVCMRVCVCVCVCVFEITDCVSAYSHNSAVTTDKRHSSAVRRCLKRTIQCTAALDWLILPGNVVTVSEERNTALWNAASGLGSGSLASMTYVFVNICMGGRKEGSRVERRTMRRAG